MSYEDGTTNNSMSNMVGFHEFVLQRQYAPRSDFRPSENEIDTVLPRYEIEEGENWLRLLPKEGRSILDDTQDTQELLDESQSSTVYPSIVALSNVGVVEAPSLDCFICIDLDGGTVAIKDMRTPDTSENLSCDIDGSHSSSNLGTRSRLGIYRKQTGYWEVLHRRRLRILSPGDRICTSFENYKPGGLCLEYQSGERPLDSKNESLSQGLLTQPLDQNGDESATQLEQSLSSQKLLVPDEDGDDDSDRTVCIEESNPLDNAKADSQSSLALLGTQPDSDEETVVEESKLREDGREKSAQGKEKDQNFGIGSKRGNDSDDDTDVGEVGPQNHPQGGSSGEYRRSVSKLGRASDDEETNKNSATLLSDPIEDSDDETDAEPKKKVYSARHLTTQLQHRSEKKGTLSFSEKQEEAPVNALGGYAEISSNKYPTPHVGIQSVQYSPSLCAETEEPPESNRKFLGKDMAPLASPIKESAQETASENSQSLLSPTAGVVEPVDVSQETKATEDFHNKNGTNLHQSPRMRQGKPSPTTKNCQYECRMDDRFIESNSTKSKGGNCVSGDRSSSRSGDQSNEVASAISMPTTSSPKTSATSNNGKEKDKDELDAKTEDSGSLAFNAGDPRIATDFGDDGRAKSPRTTDTKFPSAVCIAEATAKHKVDAKVTTHSTSSTSKSSTKFGSKIDDENNRFEALPSAQQGLEHDQRQAEGDVHTSKCVSPPLVLTEHTSPQLSRISELVNKRKCMIGISGVEGALGSGSKPTENISTSLDSYSRSASPHEEGLSKTFGGENPSPLPVNKKPRIDADAQTRSPVSSNDKRTARSSEISNLTSRNEVAPPSEAQAGVLSDRKRRRVSRETVSCSDNEAAVRVLTTGIELTSTQKGVRLAFEFFFVINSCNLPDTGIALL